MITVLALAVIAVLVTHAVIVMIDVHAESMERLR